MEFEIKKCGNGYAFYKKGCYKPEVMNNQRLMYVHDGEVPDDFDPERTCRMIEKMEEMIVYANSVGTCGHAERWCYSGRKKELLDYIEHGDKEEMVVVGVFPGGLVNPSGNWHEPIKLIEIPKSEAIRLKLFKE